jgi:hypothetical protein
MKEGMGCKKEEKMDAIIAIMIVGFSVTAGVFVLSQARKRVALEERMVAHLALHASQMTGTTAALNERPEGLSLLPMAKQVSPGRRTLVRNEALSQPEDIWEFLLAENMVKKPRTKMLSQGYISSHRFI